MENFLSFDSGTTNTKVFLYSPNGKFLQDISIKTGISFPGPLMAEQDSDGWISAIRKGIKRIKQRSTITGISGSFQGGTFVLLDRNLRPLRPAITWLDNRAKSVAQELIKEFGADFFYKKTGYVPGGWSCVAILRWLKKNEPEILKKTVRVSFVADYINHFLTDNFVIDKTSAAITTLYNLKKGQWDYELLEIAGISKSMLPEIVEADTSIGGISECFAKSVDLKSGIPVLAGGHDQYCASLGARAAEKGKILISCGTAWVLLASTTKLVFDSRMHLAPGPHVRHGIYGLMAAMSNGGVIYEWGQKNITRNFKIFSSPS
ncbi:MAG: FGGY family carbohydrate kinase, partial [Candidatus Omnitrophica bacterium]|nr:FGGY family carbohydrate kinase [Candidatus Omnitrophota bacterium]